MAYPRQGLGQSIDCTDPANYDDPECSAIVYGNSPAAVVPSSTPSPVPGLISTILTDVTQFLRPGTPTTVKTYAPATTTSQFLSNPLVLVGGLLLLATWAKGRR